MVVNASAIVKASGGLFLAEGPYRIIFALKVIPISGKARTMFSNGKYGRKTQNFMRISLKEARKVQLGFQVLFDWVFLSCRLNSVTC